MNVVIMAGGGGTRLWPLSRQKNPKQFLDLGSGRTLIEEAYRRAQAIADPANIYIATQVDYQAKILALLPDVPAEHIFLEPEKRDTTAAFASVAARLEHAGKGDVPTVFMWSDHVFTSEDTFIADLKRIPALLDKYPDYLVIVGHNPISPETNLGYLEAGEPVASEKNVFYVKAFKEKPDRAAAEQFVTAGNYFWNLGYFSARPSYLLAELIRQSPDVAQGAADFKAALAADDPQAVARAFAAFPKISLEYTLIEKTPRIIAITGDYGFSDIGYWSTVKEIFGSAGDYAPRGYHLHVGASGCYVYNATDKAVTLIGVKDIIVVVTDDTVLVTHKNDSAKIKEVVERLSRERRDLL